MLPDPSPHCDPETQHKPGHYREHYRHQQVNKEGQEAAEGEGDHHEEQEQHLGAEPGEEEGPTVEHGAQEEEEGEEEVEDPADDHHPQDQLVVDVQPGEDLPHCSGHLEIWRDYLLTGMQKHGSTVSAESADSYIELSQPFLADWDRSWFI